MVIFTSFRKSSNIPGEKYSIANYQPVGYNFPEIICLAPLTPDGKPIRSRQLTKKKNGVIDPFAFYSALYDYRQAILRGYQDRWQEILFWLEALNTHRTVSLVSWSPYSKATQEQVKDMGVFACHSGIISEIILCFRPDIEVVLDDDRFDRLVPLWRHGKPWHPRLLPG